MGIFSSKNERDNANYKAGYDSARDSQDPMSSLADGLFRGFYGEEFNKGYKAGLEDNYKYGSRD